MASEILIVDDEKDIAQVLSDILGDDGHMIRTAHNGEGALNAFKEKQPQLVLLDIWLNDKNYDGLKLLEIFKDLNPAIPVVMMSGHGTIETAVQALKLGAYDFLEKPFQTDRLLNIVGRALETSNLKRQNAELKSQTSDISPLIGSSLYVTQLKETIEKVAPGKSRIFITGPSGSGKEVIARQIHALSSRKDAPFVIANCANLDEGSLEEALFGRESTGGINVGILEQAHLGTLFLDGITDLSMETQGRMLKALQSNHITRQGSSKPIEIDVRIISSSSQDMQQAIAEKRFREELFYRLNVVPIQLTYLARRVEDIKQLAQHFLEKFASIHNAPFKDLSAEALLTLQSYSWPGNIRQLKNVIEWIVIMHARVDDSFYQPSHLPQEVLNDTPVLFRTDHLQEMMKLPLRDAREQFERDYLLAQVARFSGNISQTASFIGMERSALHRKLKTLDLTKPKDEFDLSDEQKQTA